MSRAILVLTVVGLLALLAPDVFAASAPAAEYFQHFAALGGLSVAVAKAMPSDQYVFKPHSESMSFGELMAHIASTTTPSVLV